jgi:hypothetical protein
MATAVFSAFCPFLEGISSNAPQETALRTVAHELSYK